MSSDKSQLEQLSSRKSESSMLDEQNNGVLSQDQQVNAEGVITSDDELDSILKSLMSESEPATIADEKIELSDPALVATIPPNSISKSQHKNYTKCPALSVKIKPTIFEMLRSSLVSKLHHEEESEVISQQQIEAEKQAREKIEQEKLEKERLEQERLKQAKLEAERREQERVAQEKLKQKKLKQEKLKQEKLKQEKLKQEKLRQEKIKQDRLKQAKLEAERREQERVAQEKLEEEKLKKKRLEQERLEQARLEQERLEQERVEQERLKQERLEQERLEQARLEQERLEQERVEQERLKQERLEQERLEQARLEQERLEQERVEQEKLKQEKLEEERLEKAKLEQERLEKERVEQEKLKQEKLEEERLEKAKLEQERLEQARVEQEKLKQEKLEEERLEKAKLEQERLEQERVEQEKLKQEKLKQERVEQEKLEQARVEQEKLENERLEKAKLEEERSKQEVLKQRKRKQEKLKQAKLKQEKLEQERLEQKRVEHAKLEEEKLKQKILEQERLEQARLEAERLKRAKLKQERLEQKRLDQESLKREKLETERLKKEIFSKEQPEVETSSKTGESKPELIQASSEPLISGNKKASHGKASFFSFANKVRSSLKHITEKNSDTHEQISSSKNISKSQTDLPGHQGIKSTVPVNKKRSSQLCGDLDDIDSFEKIAFDPDDFLLSSFLHSLNMAKKSHQLVQVKYNDLLLVFDYALNTVFCNLSIADDKFASMCNSPISQEKNETRELDYDETKTHRIVRLANKELSHSIESFIWTSSLLTSRGKLPKNTDVTKNICLKKKIDLSHLEPIPYLAEINALLSRNPESLLETAEKLGIPQRYVFAFYFAALNLDMIEFSKSTTTKKSIIKLFRS